MRKYLPTLSELIDRLSIAQLKEVFITEHKKEYAKEIQDIVHDIQETLDEKILKLQRNYQSDNCFVSNEFTYLAQRIKLSKRYKGWKQS